MKRTPSRSLVAFVLVALTWSPISCGGNVDASGQVESSGTGGAQGGSAGAPSKAGAAGESGPDASAGQGGFAGCSPDLSTDPLNCGVCGHDCLGGGCTAGLCQPVELGKFEPKPGSSWWVAADDQSIFVVQSSMAPTESSSTLFRVPKAGGAVLKLAEFPRIVAGMALTSDAVILATDAMSSPPYPAAFVEMVPKSGGQSTVLATEDVQAWSPVVDANVLYWIALTQESVQPEGLHSFVRSMPLAGGAVSTLHEETSPIPMIVPLGESLYYPVWTKNSMDAGEDGETIFRLAKQGAPEAKAESLMMTVGRQIQTLKVFDSKFYFFAGPLSETSPYPWELHVDGFGNGGMHAIIGEQDASKTPRDLLVDAASVYWTRGSEFDEERELMRTANGTAKAPSELLLTGLARTTLAQDDKSLYFVNKANALVRVAK